MKRNSTALAAIGTLSVAIWAATPAHAHCGKCGHGATKKDIVDTAAAADPEAPMLRTLNP